MIRLILATCVVTGFSASYGRAQDQPPGLTSRATESFDKVNNEFQELVKAGRAEYFAAYAEALKNGNGKKIKFGKPFPGPLYSPRFLAIAANDPKGADAIEALTMTLKTSVSDVPKPGTVIETRGKAIKILRDHYVDKPAIKGFLGMLTAFDDDDSKALVAHVIAQHPDRKIRVAACRERIADREKIAGIARDPQRLAFLEKSEGKEAVQQRLARAKVAQTEIDAVEELLRNDYADLYFDLAIGRQAPEIKIEALDGTEATLSALEGRVVVLDFWATWCGPCRAMIPHEREMVERLKDKPFSLISISADEKKETLAALLAKEKMPWTHWWNGMNGGVVEDWDARSFPTIYVLDTQGVIRHTNLRGEELEKAVNALLLEAEKTSASS